MLLWFCSKYGILGDIKNESVHCHCFKKIAKCYNRGDGRVNSNWRNRPTFIDHVPKDVDYILSIDESGISNLAKVLHAVKNGQSVPESEQHFVVSACLIRTRDFPAAAEQVMELKRRYWPNALVPYNGKTKRVCFHSRDIRRRTGAFALEPTDYNSFILDISQLIEDIPMTIYAAHIDKERLVKKYRYPDSPYDLCMTFILERVMRDIGDNERCVIILEARGQAEDQKLLDQIKALLALGNGYNDGTWFKRVCGVYFNPKWSKEANDQKSYWSLEVADVCAYPIYKLFAHGKRDRAFEVIETKLSRYPNYKGRGLKSFP